MKINHDSIARLREIGRRIKDEHNFICQNDSLETMKIIHSLHRDDRELAHAVADDLMLALVKHYYCKDIVDLFNDMDRWYA